MEVPYFCGYVHQGLQNSQYCPPDKYSPENVKVIKAVLKKSSTILILIYILYFKQRLKKRIKIDRYIDNKTVKRLLSYGIENPMSIGFQNLYRIGQMLMVLCAYSMLSAELSNGAERIQVVDTVHSQATTTSPWKKTLNMKFPCIETFLVRYTMVSDRSVMLPGLVLNVAVHDVQTY